MIPFFTYLKAHCAILSSSSLVMLVVFNSVQASRPRPQFHIPTFSIEQKNPKKKVGNPTVTDRQQKLHQL